MSIEITPAVIPHLVVDDGARAIDFYVEAFGATELGRMAGPDGRLVHATVQINGCTVMLADDYPEYCDGQSQTPKALGGTPVTIHLVVPDVDAAFARAVEAGAEVVMPVDDMFWGDRYGTLRDPFGHKWSLGQPVREVSQEELQSATQQFP